jgi:oligoendopeptidase F
MPDAMSVPLRSEVDRRFTWDVESIFADDAAWEAAFSRIGEELTGLSRFVGRLGDGPSGLLDWLETADRIGNDVYRVYLYAAMQHEVDTADTSAAAKYSRCMGLYGRAVAAMAFAEPEMLQIGKATLDHWMVIEPKLAVYGHYFETLWKKQAHVRSAEVEELLGSLADPFHTAVNVHSVLVDADFTYAEGRDSSGNPVVVDQGVLGALLTSPDREVRRTAFENYADTFLQHQKSIAGCIETGVKQHVFLANARRHAGCLEAALYANHIPPAVFHNLIDTFRRNLPTWHKYWAIRRRALGLEKLALYDVKAPLLGEMPTVSYTQAIDWICEGMKPLGEEYVRIMRKGLVEERWVDVYPNKGKRMGAFSTGTQGTHPFILMSYNDDVFSMSTLAHELGHSMHSWMTWHHQPPIYADYSIFVAEVASNFNQALTRKYLLDNNPDKNFRIAVIEEAMSNFHRYFFIMPTLARFELEIHRRVEQGKALPAEDLCNLMADLFAEGYSADVEVDHARCGITWAQFPTHLYSNFYVYQYATGISAAHALADRVLAEGEPAAQDYLKFLQAGSSVYPLDALKMAGVDMTQPEPVDRAFALLAAMVGELGVLLGVSQ